MKVSLQREGWKFQRNLYSTRGYPIKSLPNFPRLVMIGYIILSLKKKEVIVHQARSLLVPSVVRSIKVNA